MYITRTIEATILKAAESFPCLVIYGPRQVGKSTTVQMLFGDTVRVITLDEAEDRKLAVENPRLFLETYGWPLVIDEIQKAPGLLDEIKIRIDAQRLLWMKNDEPRQLMYILTGSNRFELQQGVSDSLAGRCGIIEMSSFTHAERCGLPFAPFVPDPAALMQREREIGRAYRPRSEVFADLFNGGMPDICTNSAERDVYFRSYVSTYIEKDVRKLIDASSELQFRNFISIVALRTSLELHYDEIANAVGIDVRTCKRWLSILETSGIIFLLQPYMANVSSRIIKAPKLYFTDTGLCAYLCRWPSAAMLQDCAMSGAFFETYIVSEMMKNAYAFGRDPKTFLYYYRDVDQKEIDLLYVDQDTLHPIEIKKSAAPKKPAKNFGVLEKYRMTIGTGFVIDTCEKIRPIAENIFAIPEFLI